MAEGGIRLLHLQLLRGLLSALVRIFSSNYEGGLRGIKLPPPPPCATQNLLGKELGLES